MGDTRSFCGSYLLVHPIGRPRDLERAERVPAGYVEVLNAHDADGFLKPQFWGLARHGHSVAAPIVAASVAETTIEPEPDDDAASEPTRHKKGALKEFILANLDPQGMPSPEARRILALAQAAGFTTTTHAAIAQAIYNIRNAAGGRPAAPRPPASVISTPTPSNVTEALRLIDEVMLGLGLVRDAVLKVKADDESTQDTLRKLRGFLQGAPSV